MLKKFSVDIEIGKMRIFASYPNIKAKSLDITNIYGNSGKFSRYPRKTS